MMAHSPKTEFLSPSLVARVESLELLAKNTVEGFLTGMHKSPYHGLAVEFASHREYVPGDDIRHVDWKVWSKTDRLYLKEHEEETTLECTLVVDSSRSMSYGSPVSKFQHAAQAVACLAYLLTQQNDRVGLASIGDEPLSFLEPASRAGQLRRLLERLERARESSNSASRNGSRLEESLEQFAAKRSRRGLVVIASDFFMSQERLKNALHQIRFAKHEAILLHTLHADELTFPFSDNTLFRGLETSTELLTEPRALRRAYLEAIERFQEQLRVMAAQLSIDYVSLRTDGPLDAALAGYLAFRRRVTSRNRKSFR